MVVNYSENLIEIANDDDDDAYLDKLQTRGLEKSILYM
jgi:hypothetical protein